jgi:hypothetical protein
MNLGQGGRPVGRQLGLARSGKRDHAEGVASWGEEMKKGRADAGKRKSMPGWTRGKVHSGPIEENGPDKILKFHNCFSFTLV